MHEPGGFLEFAKAVKQAVSIPVIAVGRIEPAVGERGIAAGHFDYLAMGRKLLADPDLPNKLAQGREKSVKPCIYCYTCVSQIFINKPVCCAVNHSTGREYEGDILARTGAPEDDTGDWRRPRRHGMRATVGREGPSASACGKRMRTSAALRRIAGLAYAPNEKLVHYLADAVRALPIALKLGTTGDRENIAALNPDHIILATGARRIAPDIPGKSQRHVFDGEAAARPAVRQRPRGAGETVAAATTDPECAGV